MFNKLPLRISLLFFLVMLFTGWNIIRVWTVLSWWSTTHEFSIHPPAWILIISGILWALAGFFLMWGIWRREAWMKNLLFGVTMGATVWYWSERLLWQMPRPNWPFAVILNLILIVFIFFTTKSSTREAHERES